MAEVKKKPAIDTRDWSVYNTILIDRGNFRELIKIVRNWVDLLAQDNVDKDGHVFEYPDALFEILGKFYHDSGRGFRYVGGFAEFLGEIMHFTAPSYSTIRRRIYTLELKTMEPKTRKESQKAEDMAIDSTGYKVNGPGEYLEYAHHPKIRKNWAKEHIVTQVSTHEILSHRITNGPSADSPQLQGLVQKAVRIQNGNHLYGDKGYGGHSNYQDCIDNGLDPVFPPKKNARSRSRGGPLLRSARIWEYQQIGHEAWKVKYGYPKRCAVEQTFAYKKQLFGSRMRAKDPANWQQEDNLKVAFFNRYMRDLHSR
jgi:hypothetical protein